jgi:hypothetical protein
LFANTDKDFLDTMSPMSTTSTNGVNYRGIVFLEVPPKFTNSDGLVTPKGFLPGGKQTNFFVLIDMQGAGYVNPNSVCSTLTNSNVPSSVAVWAMENPTNKTAVGTFK